MKHINPISIIDAVTFVYRVFGRDVALRMVTVPTGWCVARARRNGDSAEQMLAKRDRFAQATIDFAEEILNADQD
jgi:hypothetical protein